MNINLALNKIGFNMLLDESLKWEKTDSSEYDFDEIYETYTKRKNLKLNSDLVEVCLEASKDSIINADVYTLELRVTKDSRMLLFFTSLVELEPSKCGVVEFFSKDNLPVFAELFDTDNGEFWCQSDECNKEIIDYARCLKKKVPNVYDENKEVKYSLNRIALNLLLEKGLEWKETNGFNSLSKTYADGDIIFEAMISKQYLEDGMDEYILNVNVKDHSGKVLISYESRFNIISMSNMITDVWDDCKIKEFIALFELTDGSLYSISKDIYFNRIVSFANKLRGREEKKITLQKTSN